MEFKLRPWKTEDIDGIVDSITENITRFMSDSFPDTKVKWEKFILFTQENSSAYYRAIEVNGIAVGEIGVLLHDDIYRKNGELGYWINESYQGKGIVTEAINEIVTLVFENYEINRIYATPFANNFASHRVLEKAGFKIEAFFEKTVYKNGKMIDEIIYSIKHSKLKCNIHLTILNQ